MFDIKKLQEQRNAATAAMLAMIELVKKEDRGFSADEDSAWAKAEKDIADIDVKLDRSRTLAKVTEARANVREIIREVDEGQDGEFHKAHRKAFIAYCRSNPDNGRPLDQESAAIIMKANQRAFAAGTANVGGNTVPQGFYAVLDVALKATGAMWRTSEVIKTDKGNLLPYPSFNYTGIAATIVSEGVASTDDTSTPFGVTNLNAYTYRSPMLRVSFEFLDDSAFDEGFILRALGESLSRGTNAHFTTGTGTSQPKGIVVAATSGKVGLTGQTLTVIYDDVIDLVHSIDPAYRTPGDLSVDVQGQTTTGELSSVAPSVGFMMKDLSVAIVRKIKDSQGLPIWLPSYQTGVITPIPDRLVGYPVYVNQDMATMAANAKSIVFGRLNKYKIRQVKDVRVLRLVERYADQLQVGFNMFLRADGNLIDAGTHPVAYYQNSAT